MGLLAHIAAKHPSQLWRLAQIRAELQKMREADGRPAAEKKPQAAQAAQAARVS